MGRGETGMVYVLFARKYLPAKNPLSLQIEVFQDTVEKLPDIEDSVKQTLKSTFTNEARINLAREDDKHGISQLLKSQKLPAEKKRSRCPGPTCRSQR